MKLKNPLPRLLKSQARTEAGKVLYSLSYTSARSLDLESKFSSNYIFDEVFCEYSACFTVCLILYSLSPQNSQRQSNNWSTKVDKS